MAAEAFPEIAEVKPTARGESSPGFTHVQDFLARFGYLAVDPSLEGTVDNLTSEALARYQEFVGLEVTGEFDEATRDAMTRARCGLPDLQGGLEFDTTCAWDKRGLTYAFGPGTADVTGEFAAVRRAFATWAAAVQLTFTEVTIDAPHDIEIDWRAANDPDLSMVGGTLAHADFPPDCSIITTTLPKPVHFDDSEHTWSIGAVAGAFDVETVALHEIGHILGLAHSSVSGAVMFPTVSANATLRTLTHDDLDGIRSLYRAAPAVASWAPGRLDVFALGLDAQMFHKAWDNGWHPSPVEWEALGGGFASPPAVASWAPDRLDVFALGLDRQMFHKTWTPAGWAPSQIAWEPIGGTFTSPPAVASWGPERLDVFALDGGGQMVHKAWSPPLGWHPSQTEWEELGGLFRSPPAVVSWGPGRLDVFGLGLDGQMFHKAWDNGWHPSPIAWEPLGGRFTSPPAVVAWGPDRLDIFGLDIDGQMVHKAWTPAGWHPSQTDWEAIGGLFTSPPAVASWAPDRLDVFGLGLDGQMFHKAWTPAGWAPSQIAWEPIGGLFASPPAVASWGFERLDVFGLALDGSMAHKAWSPPLGWHPSQTDWEPLGGLFL